MIVLKPTYKNGQVTHHYEKDYMTIYFEDGKIKAEGLYIQNQMEGKWLFYKKEGYLWQVGHFLHSQKHGEWIIYDKQGRIISRKNF